MFGITCLGWPQPIALDHASTSHELIEILELQQLNVTLFEEIVWDTLIDWTCFTQ